MRFAICNELFAGWDHRRVCEFVARTGYQGLEIAPFTLADDPARLPAAARREVRAIAEDRGLAITGLHWLLMKPDGLHLTSDDAAVRQRTVDHLRGLVDLCADLGGAVMVLGSPNQRSLPPGTARTAGRQRARDALLACAPTARARGVTICLEALPMSQTNLWNTNAEVRAMVDEVGDPAVAMVLDVKSMCAEAMPVPDNIRACRGRFVYVQANDSNLQGPGFGDVDFVPILRALREVGYDGWISVEVFDFTPGPEALATKSLDYLRRCLP
jgi:sugar phosphate isomerase/epimerase